jgi:hypothetical protein
VLALHSPPKELLADKAKLANIIEIMESSTFGALGLAIDDISPEAVLNTDVSWQWIQVSAIDFIRRREGWKRVKLELGSRFAINQISRAPSQLLNQALLASEIYPDICIVGTKSVEHLQEINQILGTK